MIQKLKAWLWTSGRWFALPFFGGALLIGVVLAGGSLTALNPWLAFISIALIMAGGHTLNTALDWRRGLDKETDGSAEKGYSAGCRLIAAGVMTEKEVWLNGLLWYALGLVPAIVLAVRVTPLIMIPVAFGMLVTFLYVPSKFTYFHETVLASGPVAAAAIGALSTGTGHYSHALLVSVPVVLIFSFAGLALDEYPDAGQNLKSGVKSLAYKVWQYGFDLPTYIMLWVISAYVFQDFFIADGILKPLSGLTLILLPPAIATSLFLKKEESFKKAALIIVGIAMLYPILLLLGQIYG